jgi:hypothetical protein
LLFRRAGWCALVLPSLIYGSILRRFLLEPRLLSTLLRACGWSAFAGLWLSCSGAATLRDGAAGGA